MKKDLQIIRQLYINYIKPIMRIFVHDYAGHPFQVQLSRELACRGHHIRHVHCTSFLTPRGALSRRKSDPDTFESIGIGIRDQVAKYSFFKRRSQELEYAHLLCADVERFMPDAVLASNTPLDVQAKLQAVCRKLGVPFVFWLQDIYSVGIARVLRQRMPVVGAPVAWYYRQLERRLLRRSDAVIAISEDFVRELDWGESDCPPIYVIPNWAPIDEIPVLPKGNKWAKQHGLDKKKCVIYSGTLGLKHNPNLLLRLALEARRDEDIQVVVVSEGIGAEWLKEQCAHLGLKNLTVLDFQPFDLLPQVLASADLLVAILEPDAGVFSVPSKVLTYLCTARPLLLAVPRENLSARVVRDAGAGIVVDPTDENAFVSAAMDLLGDPKSANQLGRNGRRYAERVFDIRAIGDRFESIIIDCMRRKGA